MDVNGVYKPTYNWGGAPSWVSLHILENSHAELRSADMNEMHLIKNSENSWSEWFFLRMSCNILEHLGTIMNIDKPYYTILYIPLYIIYIKDYTILLYHYINIYIYIWLYHIIPYYICDTVNHIIQTDVSPCFRPVAAFVLSPWRPAPRLGKAPEKQLKPWPIDMITMMI